MPDFVPQIPRCRGNKNRPKESRWRQQTLKAYRPLYTAHCSLPILVTFSAITLAIGVLIIFETKNVMEIVIDYTNCTVSDGTQARKLQGPSELCVHFFELTDELQAPVIFQYGLSSFYQNSRMYLKSRNDVQLLGSLNETEGCMPFKKLNVNGSDLAIVPCGSIANSMFNDTYKLYYLWPNAITEVEVPYTAKKVIDEDERRRKFRNPHYRESTSETLCDAFRGTTKPTNWRYPACRLGVDDPLYKTEPAEVGIGLENLDFIVWMSPAALPTFRKNYRALKQTAIFAKGLPKGRYRLEISYNYPVADFSGSKRFIIAHRREYGVANTLLGIFYLIFTSMLVVASLAILLAHLKSKQRSVQDS